MKKLLPYKDVFINIFMTIFSFLGFLIYFKIIFSNNSYNFVLTLLFFLLYYFYKNERDNYNKSKKEKKIIINILSFILSFILIIGSIVNSNLWRNNIIIFKINNIIYSVIGVMGLFLFFRVFFVKLFNKGYYINSKNKNKEIFSLKKFIITMLIIFMCWLPYFLRYFPGIMTPDSYYSIHYVNNLILSDYHTFGHTWFFGIFFLIGKIIFNNLNSSVAFYIIIQMLINSLIFTFIIKFLYEHKVHKFIIRIILVFLCLSPLYALYSITLWRDILFGCSFILWFLSLYDFVENNYKFSLSNVLMYLISVIIILFFRNNGIYIFGLFVPFFIIFSKNNKKIIGISSFIIIILYFLIKGPIFDYFNVAKSTSSEALSIPLQQISRVIASDGDIDKEDYKYLKKVIDVDKISNEYNPTISDGIKRLVNNDKLKKSKGKFMIIWLKIFIKNPQIYVESYLCQTLGYWYPDVIYWATAGESKSIFKDNVHNIPIIQDKDNLFGKIVSRKVPLSNLIWSLGLMFIIMIFSICQLIYRKQSKYILCYIPLLCLWMTIMIATPVFSELRYIYGLFTCLPLMIVVPYLKGNIYKNKIKRC